LTRPNYIARSSRAMTRGKQDLSVGDRTLPVARGLSYFALGHGS
jgi:hypothetical protein